MLSEEGGAASCSIDGVLGTLSSIAWVSPVSGADTGESSASTVDEPVDSIGSEEGAGVGLGLGLGLLSSLSEVAGSEDLGSEALDSEDSGAEGPGSEGPGSEGPGSEDSA